MATADGVRKLGDRIELKAQLTVQLVHFFCQFVMCQQAFGNEDIDESVQDKRVVVIGFLQIGKLGDDLYLFHIYQPFHIGWGRKKLLI